MTKIFGLGRVQRVKLNNQSFFPVFFYVVWQTVVPKTGIFEPKEIKK